MGYRFAVPVTELQDGNGDPLSGGKLYFYVTGTSTPLDTYSDSALTTPNANPVVADSAGRFGDVWLKSQDYKVVLKDSADATIWTADPVRSHVDAANVTYTATGAEAVQTTVSAKLNEGISVKDFGAVGDGVTDDTAAIQAAMDAWTGGILYFPPGEYLISSTITVNFVNATSASQSVAPRIIGAGMSLTSIISASAAAFTYVGTGSFAEMGELAHLRIEGEAGVVIGDLTATISDPSGGGPYKQRWYCHHVEFRASAGTGRGIVASKMFNGRISECHFSGVGTPILLNGCDNNLIINNSLRDITDYGIYERSAQTFGSQNLIIANEIVSNSGTTAIYIKSASRFPYIVNNYIETSTHAVTIDLTDISDPAIFGANASSNPLAIWVCGNRIEGGNNATVAQYRVDRDAAHSIYIDDPWRGGSNWGSGIWVDSTEATVTTLKPVVSGTSNQVVNLGYSGICFGDEWAYFRTTGAEIESAGDLTIPHTRFIAVPDNFANNDDLRVDGLGWVLESTWNVANKATLLFPETTNGGGEWVRDGEDAFIEFEARTSSASGDTLTVAFGYFLSGYTNDTAGNFTLATQFQRFRLQFTPQTGYSVPNVVVGRSTSNGNITIRGIRIVRAIENNTMFSAYVPGDVTNVTGDGTAYTILPTTEIYDYGGNYNNTTGVFTAPFNGVYHFDLAAWVADIGAGHTDARLDLVTSNRTYRLEFNPANLRTANNRHCITMSVDADMDAGDTASVVLAVSNSTKTIDVLGSTASQTAARFSGHMVENSAASPN